VAPPSSAQRAQAPPARPQKESKPEASRPEPVRTARAEDGDVSPLITRLHKSKPLIATYLDKAVSVRKDGARIVWTFNDPFYAGAVSDARATIEPIAAEVFGERIAIEAIVPAPPQDAKRADDTPSALRDDPVVRAFQKHLGGEIVDSRKR
jgi:hypothetical protein